MQANANNNMANVAKTQRGKKKKSIISKENRNKILRAYIALYSAFLLKNLMSGMKLGAASYGALQLLNAKIATMDKQNPVTKLLKRMHKYHTKVMSKRIMTSPYRDAVPNIKPESRAKLAAFVSKKFNTANATLNAMSAMYKQKSQMVVKPKIVAGKQKSATNSAQNQQKLMLVIRMKQMQLQNHRQHAA